MKRHQQGQRVSHKILEILAARGWSENTRRVVRVEGTLDQPTLNQDFQKAGMRDTLLVSSSTTIEDMHWSFSITFSARVVNGRTKWEEGLDAFRVFSYCSLSDPLKTGCEFIVYDKNWEKLAASEELFLVQFNERLDEEYRSGRVGFSRGELQKLKIEDWRAMLRDREVPLSRYGHLDRWGTWAVLQEILVGENTMTALEEPSPVRERSRSPKRLPVQPEKKITSIFWMEWGKNKEKFPARMAQLHDLPPDVEGFYVYFFGSHTIDPFDPSKKHFWETHTTKAIRHKKAVEEALAYAAAN